MCSDITAVFYVSIKLLINACYCRSTIRYKYKCWSINSCSFYCLIRHSRWVKIHFNQELFKWNKLMGSYTKRIVQTNYALRGKSSYFFSKVNQQMPIYLWYCSNFKKLEKLITYNFHNINYFFMWYTLNSFSFLLMFFVMIFNQSHDI